MIQRLEYAQEKLKEELSKVNSTLEMKVSLYDLIVVLSAFTLTFALLLALK